MLPIDLIVQVRLEPVHVAPHVAVPPFAYVVIVAAPSLADDGWAPIPVGSLPLSASTERALLMPASSSLAPRAPALV